MTRIPPRTSHARRVLHDPAYADDLAWEMQAEEAAIEANRRETHPDDAE